jgi:hypothetical protein
MWHSPPYREVVLFFSDETSRGLCLAHATARLDAQGQAVPVKVEDDGGGGYPARRDLARAWVDEDPQLSGDSRGDLCQPYKRVAEPLGRRQRNLLAVSAVVFKGSDIQAGEQTGEHIASLFLRLLVLRGFKAIIQ